MKILQIYNPLFCFNFEKQKEPSLLSGHTITYEEIVDLSTKLKNTGVPNFCISMYKTKLKLFIVFFFSYVIFVKNLLFDSI